MATSYFQDPFGAPDYSAEGMPSLLSLSNLESLGRGSMAGLLGLPEDLRKMLVTKKMQENMDFLSSQSGIPQVPYFLPSSEELKQRTPRMTAPTPQAGLLEDIGAFMSPVPAAAVVAKPLAKVIKATEGLPVGMSIKDVGKLDALTGLPLNTDGTVTLFHHTNKSAAEQIAKTGMLKSAGESSVYLTTRKMTDTGYGDVAVPVKVKPSLLNLDDEFPNGRLDFSINTGKPKGSIPVTIDKQAPQAPQAEALRLAQQRAALSVEQGGLGLPVGNTAMDRARAMGFDIKSVFHGSAKPFDAFDPFLLGTNTGAADANMGFHFAGSRGDADFYATMAAEKLQKKITGDGYGASGYVGEYLTRSKNPLLVDDLDSPLLDKFLAFEQAKKNNNDSIVFPYGTSVDSDYTRILFDPYNIRLKDAAFDPFRRNAAIAAAMGVAAPNLLAAEQPSGKVLQLKNKPSGLLN